MKLMSITECGRVSGGSALGEAIVRSVADAMEVLFCQLALVGGGAAFGGVVGHTAGGVFAYEYFASSSFAMGLAAGISLGAAGAVAGGYAGMTLAQFYWDYAYDATI